MSHAGVARATRRLVVLLSALYVIAALAGLVFIDFDKTADLVLWLAFLLGGAGLMLAGLLVARASPWLSAALVSVGAAGGGLPLFWTILVPLVVALVIALSFVIARRSTAQAA